MLPTHGALGASLAPFKNALKMVVMLALGHRGGVAVAEGVEADAAGVVAGVLHAPLHEGRRRGQLALHRRLLVHLRREVPDRFA